VSEAVSKAVSAAKSAIIDYLRNPTQGCTFGHLMAVLGFSAGRRVDGVAQSRILDRALQALRREGHLRFEHNVGWVLIRSNLEMETDEIDPAPVGPLYEAVLPYYGLLGECWSKARKVIGDDDLLLVIDLEEVKVAKDPQEAVFAYGRVAVVQNEGKIQLPLTGAQIPASVMMRVAQAPRVRAGCTRSFWVVAINVGGRGDAGACGCVRLSLDAGPKSRPN